MKVIKITEGIQKWNKSYTIQFKITKLVATSNTTGSDSSNNMFINKLTWLETNISNALC